MAVLLSQLQAKDMWSHKQRHTRYAPEGIAALVGDKGFLLFWLLPLLKTTLFLGVTCWDEVFDGVDDTVTFSFSCTWLWSVIAARLNCCSSSSESSLETRQSRRRFFSTSSVLMTYWTAMKEECVVLLNSICSKEVECTKKWNVRRSEAQHWEGRDRIDANDQKNLKVSFIIFNNIFIHFNNLITWCNII